MDATRGLMSGKTPKAWRCLLIAIEGPPEMSATRREWLVLAGPSQGRTRMRTTDPPVIRR